LTDILKVRNLNYSIGEKQIVQKINLSLKKHAILALLGQSGSGKSTILKLIAGLLEPSLGEIQIEGERVIPPSKKLIPGHTKIKIVRQDNPLFPNISLRENIEYELRFFNEDYRQERVDKLLKVTGLQKVAHQLPRHSSEGEQQRTSIARALADEPALLLLDEPFSNLDYKNKSILMEEIKQIVSDEEMACIFVTHDISDVFGTADELAILKKGKITQKDLPIEIFNSPKSIYEASITGEYNVFSQKEAKETLGIKTKAKQIIFRPKSVIVSLTGGYKGVVKRVIDKGAYFEIKIDLKGKGILVYSIENHSVNSSLKFDISFFSEL
jgi:ABC-type Fe3+/spermidine/putrescine transport system ATPase subunit